MEFFKTVSVSSIIDTSLSRATLLDNQFDSLAKYKTEFSLPQNYLYFSAHQLGPMSKRVKAAMLDVMDCWEQHANGGWS